MIHSMRNYHSKYETAKKYVESYKIDLFAKGSTCWIIPRAPASVNHKNAYSDDKLTVEGEFVTAMIVPGLDPMSGYVACVQTRRVHSLRGWFQPETDMLDHPYVQFHRLITLRQFTNGLDQVIPILRRDDTGLPRWPLLHVLLDDSSLGTVDSAPFQGLTAYGDNRFVTLRVLIQRQFQIDSEVKEILAAGSARMLSDLRSIVLTKRLVIPEEISNNPLGRVLLSQIKSHITRGSDGSVRLNSKRNEYLPDQFGLLYAAGLATSYAELTAIRLFSY